jgi:predicted nucleotidyltransferase
MRPSEALEIHREFIRETCAKYGLSNPRVFGSVARGTDTVDSDIDLMVDTNPTTSLFELNGAAQDIGERLGVKIDICTPPMIREAWRDEINAITIPV